MNIFKISSQSRIKANDLEVIAKQLESLLMRY